ncbi:hypothetical protein ACFVSN_30365 [Kitasatospora sp. NPDC057904]|uniref:hypothetical protein n=1 Tax=unclassified Kitasatospora TaxID=2633591 RepID=UPI0036D7C109
MTLIHEITWPDEWSFPMRNRVTRTVLVAVAALGLSASASPATSFADSTTNDLLCRPGQLCLFSGAGGTGEVLYAVDEGVQMNSFTPRIELDVKLPGKPKSVRNPLRYETFKCGWVLNDGPSFEGSEQRVTTLGVSNLDLAGVRSIGVFCGRS